LKREFWKRWSLPGSDREVARSLGLRIKTLKRVKEDLIQEKKDR